MIERDFSCIREGGAHGKEEVDDMQFMTLLNIITE